MIRRPGETANSKFTACCLVPFSLPFILMPLFFLYMVWFGKQPVDSAMGKIGVTLFVSIFLLVGVGMAYGGIYSSLRAMGYGAKASKADDLNPARAGQGLERWAWFPKAQKNRRPGLNGGVRLQPETTALMVAIGLGIFAVIWNGFIGTIFYFMITETAKSPPLFAKIIVGVMLLAGLGILWAALHAAARVFMTGETYLDVSAEPVSPGQTISWALIQKGSYDVREAKAVLLCRETVRYTVGTDTVTKTETVRTIEIAPPQPGKADSIRPVMEGRLSIPPDGAPSFNMPNNRIEWGIETELIIDGRPDVKAFFPIRVIPSQGGY
jgi:hypothetical protein